MIEKFKKRLSSRGYSFKSLTAMFIFGAIVLVFVFFGLPGRNAGGGHGAAARVNESLISVADLKNESQRLEQMYAPLFGGQISSDAQRQFVRNQALDNLITMELISQSAKKSGILSTDAEIRDYIVKDIPIFQKEGRFQRDLYSQYLDYVHSSPGEFEEKIRKDRKNQRTRRLFEAASLPIALEIEKMKSLKEQKINVAFAKIDKEVLIQKINISESEIKAKLAEPNFENKVEAYFKANKSEFSKAAQVHALHILIKAENGNVESEKKALEKASELQKRALNEDFGKLAKEFSEDEGSKVKEGDLGFFEQGKMVPEFEKVAFSQAVGVVGNPVKTNYGYHIIKVLEKKGPEEQKLEAVKNQIAKKLIVSEKIDNGLKALEEALIKGDQVAVDTILKDWGVAWSETGFFDLSQETVPQLASPVASQAAFELTETKPLLNHLVRDAGIKYVLKLKSAKKETLTAAEEIKNTLAKDRTNSTFSKWIESAQKSATIEKNSQVISGR